MQTVVDQFNLSKWVGQEEARLKLIQAGYRGQAPYVTYLFFRLVTPIAMLHRRGRLRVRRPRARPAVLRQDSASASPRAYLGMQLPLMFLKNRIAQRQLSIKRAFPDALDLLLICVESGMSIEAAFKKVAERDRHAIDPARRRADADHRRAVLSAGSPAGLRKPRQAHRSRRRQIGLHGAAAGRALRHAARQDACACWRRKTATCACRKPRRRPPACRPS